MKFKNFNIRVPWGKLAVRNWGADFAEKNCEKILFINGMHSWSGAWNHVADELVKQEFCRKTIFLTVKIFDPTFS